MTKSLKSTLRIKKMYGIDYWYEDIPYYDKEKKQIRHQSKYIGRNVNSKPVRVQDVLNSSDGISSNDISLPSSKPTNDYNYGEFLPLQKITDELKIGEYLGELFNEKDRNMILAMAPNNGYRTYKETKRNYGKIEFMRLTEEVRLKRIQDC